MLENAGEMFDGREEGDPVVGGRRCDCCCCCCCGCCFVLILCVDDVAVFGGDSRFCGDVFC